jgi:hypothetical protein
MRAMNFYIEQANLTIDIEDRKIENIMRGNVDENAIELDVLDATFDLVHIDRPQRRLYLDWLALSDLATWLHCEQPGTFKAEGHRFMKLFPGSSLISDLVRALFRCVRGQEHEAAGESEYFVGKIRKSHPVELMELRASWTARYIPVTR